MCPPTGSVGGGRQPARLDPKSGLQPWKGCRSARCPSAPTLGGALGGDLLSTHPSQGAPPTTSEWRTLGMLGSKGRLSNKHQTKSPAGLPRPRGETGRQRVVVYGFRGPDSARNAAPPIANRRGRSRSGSGGLSVLPDPDPNHRCSGTPDGGRA